MWKSKDIVELLVKFKKNKISLELQIKQILVDKFG